MSHSNFQVTALLYASMRALRGWSGIVRPRFRKGRSFYPDHFTQDFTTLRVHGGVGAVVIIFQVGGRFFLVLVEHSSENQLEIIGTHYPCFAKL